jgi:hypothetical protein
LDVSLSFDSLEPPPGKELSRFSLLRPRLYLDYPNSMIEITHIDKPDEAAVLAAPNADGVGVVYWARQNDEGAAEMLPGETETLRVEARLRDNIPNGTPIPFNVVVRSQRTLDYQNVDASHTLTVTESSAGACGDGFCTVDETEESCAADCPVCVGEGDITAFDLTPCCDGLSLIRDSQPYSWAYNQCYDWEGGGVPYAQAYCTRCGDGKCLSPENPCNCPEDCGPACGNWICEDKEDRASCPGDC